MTTICLFQGSLILANTPGWMKYSSAAVIALSGVFFIQGYIRRMVLRSDAVCLRSLLGQKKIAWREVRKIGIYAPDGVGTSEYLYITRHEREPLGKWENGRRR